MTGHPLAQRLHISWPLGIKELTYQGFGTLRPHFGGTLNVQGYDGAMTICRSSGRFGSF